MMNRGSLMGRGSTGQNSDSESVFGSAYDKSVILRLLPFMKPYKKYTTFAILAMLVFTSSMVSVPFIIGKGLTAVGRGDLDSLTMWFIALVSAAVLNFTSNKIQQTMMAKIGQGMLYDLRKTMFKHLHRLSLSFYDRTEVGVMMSRVQGDVYQLQEFVSIAIMTLADLLGLIGIVIVMMTLNFKLGLISMSVLPILVFIMIFWQPIAVRAFIGVRKASAILNAYLNENITGVRVVQAMNREPKNFSIFNSKNQNHLNSNLFTGKMMAFMVPIVDILTALSIGLVIFFGIGMVNNGEIASSALFVTFILYIQRFFDPIRNLTMQYTQLQRSMASGQRIFQTLDVKPDLIDSENSLPMHKISGNIEFDHVSFNYLNGEDVLKNISFNVKSGQTVAIVGPTGAGKTTIVALLQRFYDVQIGRGSIKIDGTDIRDVTRNSIVSQMSMVLQEPYLFSGTIAENIKYNHIDLSHEQVIFSAKSVGAHEFIKDLPNGYYTEVAERGVNLSLGQRQLISFARAIAANPSILILDEATASIDSISEMMIQKAMQLVLKGRTAIVIAHRLSTIRGSDKILVVNDGEINQSGTHEELLQNPGIYSKLYQMNYEAFEDQPA